MYTSVFIYIFFIFNLFTVDKNINNIYTKDIAHNNKYISLAWKTTQHGPEMTPHSPVP